MSTAQSDNPDLQPDSTKPGRSFHIAYIASLSGITVLIGFLCWCSYVLNAVSTHGMHIPVTAAATCTEKLGQMDNVITLWAERNGKRNLDQPAPAEVAAYFKGLTLPVCEEGGTYTLGTLAIGTTCSIHGHAQMTNSTGSGDFAHEPIRIARHGAPPRPDLYILRQIDGAIQQWALENHKKSEDTINPQEIAAYLKGGDFPLCPCGGKYNVGKVSANPTCTVRGHEL